MKNKALLAACTIASLACASSAFAEGSAEHWSYEGLAPAFAETPKPHWSYVGQEGPEHWGDLAAEYASCSNGKMQSPIDLAEADASGTLTYTIDYKAAPLTIFNNGHTVEFNVGNGSKITEKGVDFALTEVHFHAPSEHVVKAEHHPLEAHFVHKSDSGALAVVGVFIDEGAENPALAVMLKHLPKDVSEPVTLNDEIIDPNGLLPEDKSAYRYMGSLTTPPCSEGVNWHVLSHAATASKAQIDELSAVLNANARAAQPLNSRLVVSPSD